MADLPANGSFALLPVLPGSNGKAPSKEKLSQVASGQAPGLLATAAHAIPMPVYHV